MCVLTACAGSIRTDSGVGSRYRLTPGTSLRREAFGGISYSHATRRLRLVHSTLAVDIALMLDDGNTLDSLILDSTAIRSPSGSISEREIRLAVGALVTAGILVDLGEPVPGNRVSPPPEH
jgi:putative mycofactocin binding protein MftB